MKFESLGVGVRASVSFKFLSFLGDSNEQVRLQATVWEGGKCHILETTSGSSAVRSLEWAGEMVSCAETAKAN